MTTEDKATVITPALNLEKAKKEATELVKKHAWISAGAAIIPIPFFDVVADVSNLSILLPKINEKFGLAAEQITLYDMKTRQIHWDELRKRGIEFVGLVGARTVAKQGLSGIASKVLTKQVTKFIPLGGQIIAASLGYIVLKKIALEHVEESYKLAKQVQVKQA